MDNNHSFRSIIPTGDPIPKRIPQPMTEEDIPADTINPEEYNRMLNAQRVANQMQMQQQIQQQIINDNRPLAERMPEEHRLKKEEKLLKIIIFSLASFIIFELAFELFFNKFINDLSYKIFNISSEITLSEVDASYIRRLNISNVFRIITCNAVVILIAWLVVRDRFRKVYLSIENQRKYILATSIMTVGLIGLYFWNFYSQLNRFIEKLADMEGFDVVTSLTKCYKIDQIIAMVICFITCIISFFVIKNETIKRNYFVQY